MKPIHWFLLPLLMCLVAGCVPITPTPAPVTPTPTPAPSPSATPTLTPPPTATPTPVPVPLVLWEGLPPEQTRVLLDGVAEFEARHPGVTVEARHYEDDAALLQQIESAQSLPWDLVLGDAALLAALQQRNALQPLDGLLPADALADLVTPARTGASRDGHLWGLADTVGLHLLLFYNRDLIAVPPADTNELTSVAQSFTRRDQWGLAMNSYDPLWVVPWLAAYGGWLTDAAGNPALDSPAMVEALTLHLRWHGDLAGVAPPATQSEARQLFVEGKAAMMIDGDWAIGELRQVSAVKWGVAPLPLVGDTGRAAAPLVMGRYWALRRDMPPDSARAALDFLAYVFSPARQLSWTTRFGQLPANRRALEDPRILSDPWLRASAQQMQTGRGLQLGVDANRLLDAMRGPLRALLDGDMVPEEAAKAMQRGLGDRP